MNEFEILDVLLAELEQNFPPDELGPGDDCAVVKVNGSLLVSSDMLLDRVHFRRDWSSPADIAWKALAVNESDIAAMGGVPLGFTLNIGCPNDLVSSGFLRELYSGFSTYLRERKLRLYGGDLVRSKDLTISVTALGATSKKSGSPLTRSQAKPGDVIWVSGEIGLAGLGLKILESESSGISICIDPELKERAISHHKRPVARTELALELVKSKLGRSMIDISDGLFQDAKHIAKASGVTLNIYPDMIPVPKLSDTFLVSPYLDLGPTYFASAGDDYELLFTADPSFRPDGQSLNTALLTAIGRVAPLGESSIMVARGSIDVFSAGHGCSDSSNGGKLCPLSQYLAEEGYDASRLGYSHF